MEAAQLALGAAFVWTGSRRHAVPATELYAAVRALQAMPPSAVFAATRAAVAILGGWPVLRGNRRHVRGVKPKGLTDIVAWRYAQALRLSLKKGKDDY